MILFLNDDCLFCICKCLNFADQSSLAHTCKRLQNIVEENWRHKCHSILLDNEQTEFFNEHIDYFNEFMSCISSNVHELEIRNIKWTAFQSLEKLDFLKTTSLSIQFHYSNQTLYDEETKLIVKLFPHLTKLSILSYRISGKHLWNMVNLEELNLGGCESLKEMHFKKIFSTLRLKRLDIMYHGYNTCFDERAVDITECKTLEELRIDDHHLLLFCSEISKLKRLQKLVVYTRDYDRYILEEIVKSTGDTMHTIIFDDVFWSQEEHCESVKNMKNLHSLLFRNDDIEGNQLKVLGENLGKSLKEFRFIKGRWSEAFEEGLIEFLMCCKKLEVLDISGNSFDVEFLQKLIKGICDWKDRKKLKVCCFDTKITDEAVKRLSIPKFFEITCSKQDIRYPGARCIQIEWYKVT